MDAGCLLRAVRRERAISQRELAELAGLPRSTIDRIEAGRSTPRIGTVAQLLTATGVELVLRDHRGRILTVDEDRERLRDCADRHFPAHLRSGPTPSYMSADGVWWGWHTIAWPATDDWVPANTYWRRSAPQSRVPPTTCRPSSGGCGTTPRDR